MIRAVTVFLLLAAASSASTLSDDLAQSLDGSETVMDTTWIAANFRTGMRSYRLTDASLLLSGSAADIPALYLFSDMGSQPGAQLGQFTTAGVLKSAFTPVSFTSTGLPLSPNASYWLVLKAPAGQFDWGWTASSTGSGTGFTTNWAATDDAGFSWFVSQSEPMLVRINADPVNPTAVPEPGLGPFSMLAMLSLVLLYLNRSRLHCGSQKVILSSLAVVMAPGLLSGQSRIHFYRPNVIDPPKVIGSGDAALRCPTPNTPCFKDNKDILNGNRTLLQIQDLVIGNAVLPVSGNSQVKDKDTSQLTTIDPQTALGLTHGHFFNTPNEQLSFVQGNTLTILDPVTRQAASITIGPKTYQSKTVSIAVGDFNHDGYQDLVIGGWGNLQSLSWLQAVTVKDPQNISSGLLSGDVAVLLSYDSPKVAVGDFNGDGLPEVAVNAVEDCFTFTVDPLTLALYSQKVTQTNFGNLYPHAFAVGRFTSIAHDQLYVVGQVYVNDGPTSYTQASLIDFDSTLKPIQVTEEKQTFAVPDPNQYRELIVSAGHFDPSSPYNQLLVKATPEGCQACSSLFFYTFNPDATLHTSFVHQFTELYSTGLAVGNFNRQDPAPNGQTTLSLKQQIAIASSTGEAGNMGINVYNIDPPVQPGGEFIFNPKEVFGKTFANQKLSKNFWPQLIMGVDVQGRSKLLGQPVITVLSDHKQPSVILASPPMHIDALGYPLQVPSSPLTLFNFTATPSSFYSGYESSDSNGVASSTKNSTTWSFAATEKETAQFTAGDCDAGPCADLTTSFSAKQKLKGSTTNEDSQYQTQTEALSFQTVFDDYLIASQSTLTIYTYPILGSKVCPQSQPNCTDDQKIQASVQFAGPDTISELRTGATAFPWYQPAWMPGNLLSYPGNATQLAYDIYGADSGTFEPLTPVNASWTTDPGIGGSTTSFTSGGSTDQTVQLNGNFSFELDTSFLIKDTFLDVLSASSKTELNLGGSYGFSNLTDTSKTLTQAKGLSFTRSGNFLQGEVGYSDYTYSFSPIIFGQAKKSTYVDTKLPVSSNGANPPAPDITTWGPFRSAYTVNPTGPLWSQWYKRAIDIGLNHPQRWVVQPSSTNTPNVCLVPNTGSSQFDCASLANNTPANPLTDNYHALRGFFVQGQAGTGPQIGQVTAGAKVTLGVRIYNFSLADMPAGSRLKVRFYARPFGEDDFPDPKTPSTLIAEVVAQSTVPKFDPDAQNPNWVLIQTSAFDTSKFANQTVGFWVLAWAEDANSNLISDLPEHGLKSIPPANIEYDVAASYEEPYGNNLGFFPQLISVVSPPASAAVATGTNTTAEVILAGADRTRVTQGEAVTIAVKVRTGDADLHSGLAVHFYDGDPRTGGKLLAYRSRTYLESGKTYTFQTLLHFGEVGVHPIFVTVGEGKSLEHTVELRPVTVMGTRAASTR